MAVADKDRYTPKNGRRSVILALNDIDVAVEKALTVRMGQAGTVIPRLPIIEILLDEFFYGVSLGKTLTEELQFYRIPSDVLLDLRSELRSSVGRQIDSALCGIRPYAHYSFKVVRGTVVLTELVNIRQLDN